MKNSNTCTGRTWNLLADEGLAQLAKGLAEQGAAVAVGTSSAWSVANWDLLVSLVSTHNGCDGLHAATHAQACVDFFITA